MRRFRHGGFASSFCNLACSRPSDSEEDAKVKGTRNVGRAKKRKRKAEGKSPSGLFSSSRFLNFSGPVYLGAWLFCSPSKRKLTYRSTLLIFNFTHEVYYMVRSNRTTSDKQISCKDFSRIFQGKITLFKD